MEDSEYFRAKAEQCRRLVRSISDRRAIEALTEMAKEFEAKAAQAEVAERVEKGS